MLTRFYILFYLKINIVPVLFRDARPISSFTGSSFCWLNACLSDGESASLRTDKINTRLVGKKYTRKYCFDFDQTYNPAI